MNRGKILENAIQMATDNGWEGNLTEYRFRMPYSDVYGRYVEPIIFNHDFAKALWGEEVIEGREFTFAWFYEKPTTKKTTTPIWQHHLQQMVVADDPIEYLEENLPSK